MPIVLDGTNGIDTPDLASAGPISGTTGTFSGAVSGTTGSFPSGVSVGPSVTFGDATVQTTAAVVNTTAVLNATAGATAGGTGTYAFMYDPTGTTNYSPGTTIAGSVLRFTGITTNGSLRQGGAGSGTWRAVGYGDFQTYGVPGATMFLRIS